MCVLWVDVLFHVMQTPANTQINYTYPLMKANCGHLKFHNLMSWPNFGYFGISSALKDFIVSGNYL